MARFLIWASYGASKMLKSYANPRPHDRRGVEHLFKELERDLFTAEITRTTISLLKDLKIKYPENIRIYEDAVEVDKSTLIDRFLNGD